MKHLIELLSPAGTFANLNAAIEMGADSVYLGMNKFNARQSARNFNRAYLKEAVKLCKSNNILLYLTMNTLVKNSELKEFVSDLSYAYECGIDSVIIQHPSLIEFIRKNFPELKIHMSTQAGVMNSFHANLFNNSDRIILARELSLEDLKSIRENYKKELEIFVHGALCVSVSGSCLFSSLIGGRSGNRGKCAQPCRKKYNGKYLLSTKELCLIDKIPEIIEMGIDSVKIEGRMRTPFYVAETTRVYRTAIDSYYSGAFKITKEMRESLANAFSREFTCGVYSGENVFNINMAEGVANVSIKEYLVKSKDLEVRRCPRKVEDLKFKEKSAEKSQLLVRVYNLEDALVSEENGADIIYLDIFSKDFLEVKKKLKCKVYAVTPRIMKDKDFKEIVSLINKLKPDGILAGNLGMLNLDLKIPVHLDYNCNCFNDLDLEYIESKNAFPIISPELSIKEMTEFKNKNFAVLVHGNLRLMTLAHKFGLDEIKDEKGFLFRIEKIFNGVSVINDKELGFFNKAKKLTQSGIVNFFIDGGKDVGKMVDIYRKILDGKTVDVSKIRNDYVLGWSNKGVL